MKLTHLTVNNFLGIRHVDIDITTPVTLFSGLNGAGKSSLRDAVCMALTGTPERISLKKELGELVFSGEEKGRASVVFDHGAQMAIEAFIDLPGGKGYGGGFSDHAALPYVLDAQNFARHDANERRKFLFGLMGVKLDSESIVAQMLGKAFRPTGLRTERFWTKEN
jgi:hypothetical protein